MKVEEVSSPTIGYRFPAEWEPHAATWLAWPHRRATFLGDFDEVPLAFVKLVRLLARYEPVRVIGSENVLRHASPLLESCLLYTSPSPRDRQKSRMPSSA